MKQEYHKKFACVSWSVIDVKEVNPNWSTKKCSDWLAQNERRLEEHMIQSGYMYINCNSQEKQ